MSSFEQKIESARTLVQTHNKNVDSDAQIDFDAFLKRLRAEGGTSEAALKLCTWEDLQEWGQLPRLLARQIADSFREKGGKKSISRKQAETMSVSELLAAYNPKDLNVVWERLKDLSHGQPCIVFTDDGKVNVSASAECLDDIVEGFEPRSIYVGEDGVPFDVLPVGEKPAGVVAENPLIPGRPLRGSQESCDTTHRSYAGIPHEARVALRLALNTKELVIDQVGRIHDTLDLLVGKDEAAMMTTLARRFPKAALLYKAQEKSGELPTLRIMRKGSTRRKQDPFFRNKTY